MKVAIILVDGFEDGEAIISIDLLKRAKIDVDKLSLSTKQQVLSASDVLVECDDFYNIDHISNYDAIILPGGPGYKEYYEHPKLAEGLALFKHNNRLIAAICAAPAYLANINLLTNVKATAFPEVYDQLLNNNVILSTAKVVVSGNFITAQALGSTFEFALAIIKYLKDEEIHDQIKESIYY